MDTPYTLYGTTINDKRDELFWKGKDELLENVSLLIEQNFDLVRMMYPLASEHYENAQTLKS
jgi:hypothetical protein